MAVRERTATVDLKVRLKESLRAQIEAAAREHGVSLNSETAARLERSFQDEELLPQLLEIAYGREVAGLLLALGSVMRDAGEHAGVRSLNTFSGAAEWFANPIAYEEARAAAATVLDALRPSGDASPRRPRSMPTLRLGLASKSPTACWRRSATLRARVLPEIGPLRFASC